MTKGDILFNGTSLLSYTGTVEKSAWNGDFHDLSGSRSHDESDPAGLALVFTEYIRRPMRRYPKRMHGQKVKRCLEQMRLPSRGTYYEVYPFQLSGGMRQRVGIAMAMTFQPKLLLADEPTSALDVTTQAQIVRQMMELRDEYGTGIIVVTHNLGVAAYMADRIVVMKDGTHCGLG